MKDADRIFVATMDTPSFTFTAYGRTAGECSAVMRKALRRHIRETGADPKYFDPDEDPTPAEVVLGRAYRDGTEFAKLEGSQWPSRKVGGRK
jgi:hypothetical protein